MDPFWEKVFFLVLDKGLLALAGGGIAFAAALALEKYRRQQAVALELGKLRAQAYARIVGATGVVQAKLELRQKFARIQASPSARTTLEEELRTALVKLYEVAANDAGMLDEDAVLVSNEYITALFDFDEMSGRGAEPPGEAKDLAAQRARLKELRQKLVKYVPPLPRVG